MEKNKYRILAINPGSTSTKIGLFDNDECIFKTTINHTTEELAPFKEISDQKEFRLNILIKVLEENNIDIGIICTTKDNAQEVADKMCFAGVKGIWNFAPIDLEVPDHVAVENVHLSDSLHSLAYHMNRNGETDK